MVGPDGRAMESRGHVARQEADRVWGSRGDWPFPEVCIPGFGGMFPRSMDSLIFF